MSYPPNQVSTLFNSSFFDSGQYLTPVTGDLRYLRISGGNINGSLDISGNLNITGTLSIAGSLVNLSLITGVTPGTSSNSKALSLNSSGVLDKLTLDYAGIGLDCPTLKFSGTTFDQSLYLNMIQGSAQASKALVLNSTRDISNINNITTTGALTTNFTNNTGTLISYQSWSNTVGTPINMNLQMSSSGTRLGTSSNHNFRLMSNNAIAIFMDGSQNVAIGPNTPTSGFKFDVSGACLMQTTLSMSNLANKTLIRTSTISSSGGIELYDTQFAASSSTMLNFITGNNSSPTFIRMCGYLNSSTTVVANGMPHDIRYIDGLGFCGGLNITCTNPTQAPNNNYNVVLSARNGTIPHVVVNDQKNQLHLFPLDLAEINTSYVQNVICGYPMLIRRYLCIGDSQDTSRLLSMLDSTQAVGTSRYMTLGQSASSNNQAEISFYYAGSGSTSNRIDFGFYGGAKMFLTGDGRLGIATSSPFGCCSK
jgi:hypothetical protein